jgi:hypothetical protein
MICVDMIYVVGNTNAIELLLCHSLLHSVHYSAFYLTQSRKDAKDTLPQKHRHSLCFSASVALQNSANCSLQFLPTLRYLSVFSWKYL